MRGKRIIQKRLFEYDIPTSTTLPISQPRFRAGSKTVDIVNTYNDPIIISDSCPEMVSTEKTVTSETTTVVANEEVEVRCPICDIDISSLQLFERDVHAEQCLEKTGQKKVMAKRERKRAKGESKTPPTPSPSPQKRPPLPSVKILSFKSTDFKIIVDGFNYSYDRIRPDRSAFFLSHFHSDHYIGLSGRWNANTLQEDVPTQIYCSPITSRLLQNKFKWSPNRIVELETHTRTWITPEICVIPIDANHCPGATVFIFQEFKDNQEDQENLLHQIVHTGDFRSNPAMIKEIQNYTFNTKINQIYLDTTYLTPGYHFPLQKNVLETTAAFASKLYLEGKVKTFNDTQKQIFRYFKNKVEEKPCKFKLLVVIGTYSIGKEKLAIEVAKSLKTKIFVPDRSNKFKIISQYIDWFPKDIITHDANESCVHLVPLQTLHSMDNLQEYFKKFKDIYEDLIGFVPTGWTYANRFAIDEFAFPDMNSKIAHCTELIENKTLDLFDEENIIKQYKPTNRFQIFKVPYSEHSSFKDLSVFGTSLQWEQMIATVNLHNLKKVDNMSEWFSAWKAVGK